MIITSELIARIVRAENAVILSRVKSVQKMEGNPLGVEARHFDHVLATLMQKHPETWWNRVGGLTRDDERLIDPILDWYRQFDIACAFDIVPHQSSESLLRQLTERGFSQSSFRQIFFGAPNTNQMLAQALSSRERSRRSRMCGRRHGNFRQPR